MVKIYKDCGSQGLDLPGCKTCRDYTKILNAYIGGMTQRDFNSFTGLSLLIDDIFEEGQKMTPEALKTLGPHCLNCGFGPGIYNDSKSIKLLRDWVKETEKELPGVADKEKTDYIVRKLCPAHLEMRDQTTKATLELSKKYRIKAR